MHYVPSFFVSRFDEKENVSNYKEKGHSTLLCDCCINVRFVDPFLLPHQQVDKGAIKFVLSGANIMCPGLTSPGAKLYPADSDTVVAIMAEGKQHALCVGVMKMSAENIEKVNKGIGIENVHYLNDGLWHMKTYK
uniref:MCTS1 re-initiation and release factor n=1 Tax=Neogobius melanostomus TaxID=47308 RepID=A0A8C6SM53_9GOBI